MEIIGNFIGGFVFSLRIIGAPMLYRYPYRISAEGLRTDWMRIGKDIESVIGQLEAEADHGRRDS